MADPIVFSGTVEWLGENPGISLKGSPDGPFVALASFFRVVLSPRGRGHALVLLQSPHESNPPSERANYCLSDNEALARYLVAEFVSNFGAYKGLASLGRLVYRQLDSVEASGDPASTYRERVRARRARCRTDLERARRALLLRPAARQVGHGQASYAEPVRRMPGRLDHGERAHPRGQTRPA